jgi:hypothetical protein
MILRSAAKFADLQRDIYSDAWFVYGAFYFDRLTL